MKLIGVVCIAVALVALQGVATTTKASDQDAINARLDALEKENAALRQRLNRMERAAATSQRAASRPNSAQTSELETSGSSTLVMDTHGQAIPPPDVYKNPVGWNSPPHFEVSGSLLFLQPGAGNLEYGTLVTPFPIATPNWANQSLAPNFSPAFGVGARYMPNEFNDIELNWTHLNSSTNASFSGSEKWWDRLI